MRHIETVGAGPRIVLLHGSVTPGWLTWNAQKPLADRFTLVVPIRSGYPPNPRLERIDFEGQARELLDVLEPGDHLVAHSYGAVVSLSDTGSPRGSAKAGWWVRPFGARRLPARGVGANGRA